MCIPSLFIDIMSVAHRLRYIVQICIHTSTYMWTCLIIKPLFSWWRFM